MILISENDLSIDKAVDFIAKGIQRTESASLEPSGCLVIVLPMVS